MWEIVVTEISGSNIITSATEPSASSTGMVTTSAGDSTFDLRVRALVGSTN